MTNTLLLTKTRHKIQKWVFITKNMVRLPQKMEILKYLQKEDEIYEQICDRKNIIKILKCQNYKLKVPTVE